MTRNSKALPTGQKDEIPQHALPTRVGTALETLTAWGRRERGLTTLGALLAELSRAIDLPEDVVQAWDTLDACLVADFAGPGVDTPLAELLDECWRGSTSGSVKSSLVGRLWRTARLLQELADRWRVTRERIRQIQVELSRRLLTQ